ncbi:MAG: DNA internalization-related competence protein ComEC/Rec2 [Gammaproteobacteria bacterium]|uniref:DNA internalization-related competence protein ComEC/Rec2 n=1 Tax=Hydrogenophaga sp. TaxID=1904254 RepID=UPI0025C6A5AE|nr:DNA internalization-related competence protein ComEC/Rec2 [Hydrogenophaga sp.]MBU4183991.1 DNA internalization-related competence protein ComEC/Rec2 [Gammaproteobacteria bacterium]MBU4283039.1 DNA internalization-related competence protein ComEC/Rec2 [Gammaproteobacteria bacterium]MBU4324457.1 DNA internalization-related competence protein ComEC/Rec2 [Gammaproteobacteria bacterium]MCG2655442.1 DNA internalization-related competence protein ComEC/Rec2 [Hydrogenophaga sp.]
MAGLVLAWLPGWVLGVACQLQQAALWPWQGYAALLLASGLLMAGLLWRGSRGGRPAAWVLVLAVAAGAWAGAGLTGVRAAHFASQALDPALQGLDIEVTGRIHSMPRRHAEGARFELAVESAAHHGRPVRLPPLLQLAWYSRAVAAGGGLAPGPDWRAGERWRLTVRLSAPHGNANPHGFDRERWLWENGIGATGYVRNGPRDPLPQRLAGQGWYPLESMRQTVGERIAGRVDDARSAGVLAALVVGDQSAIERSDWDLFRTTGVAHLMSISGLHVTMFAWLAIWLVGGLWRRLAFVEPQALLAVPVPWAAGLGGVALAAAYALFSGWGVPSQRTVLMLAVVVGLRLLARQWPWPVVWLLAMAAVLLLDPWALLQPGFWLSFVAVAILFATDPGRRVRHETAPFAGHEVPTRTRRLMAAAMGMLREQSVVTVALAPLSLLLFGQFSFVSLVANLLAIPWVTLVITPLAMLGVAVPAFWDLAALAVQGLGGWLAWLAQWPSAAVFRPIPPLPLALAGVLGGALLVMRWPWATRLAGLVLLWPVLSWQPPRPAPGAFDVMALDVGQGSAVLVRTAGHSLLYDTGPRYSPTSDAGQRIVVPLLRALGERPDTVVVSHRDSDHAGGSAAVQTEWPEARWLSSFDADPARRCTAGQRWTWDGVDFEILHPSPEDFGPDGGGRLPSNAMSCVLRVGHARQSVWLSGDLDADRETRLALARPDLRATLLLAPHHGSLTSSSPVLLNTLAPAWALVQAGYRNRFNHPAPAVLARYRERDMRWVATPDCGAATWRSDVPDTVVCQREAARRYWHHRGEASQPAEPILARVPEGDRGSAPAH